jgi:secondary thiamine-phosphate synthase enzyme
MPWQQVEIRLKPRPRGFHLVTREIVEALPDLRKYRVGVAHLYIQHTSASLTINENADPDVRADMERWFDQGRCPRRRRTSCTPAEGPDDMPAHLKASLLGSSVSVPIATGGSRSGRGRASISASTATTAAARTVVVTLNGET